MREILIVDRPYHAPGMCMICGTNEGKMFDTGVDIAGDGRMYVCVRTCLRIAAQQAGLSAVPITTVYSTSSNSYVDPRCSALKANGERCNGRALPRHHTCVAHTRVKEAV